MIAYVDDNTGFDAEEEQSFLADFARKLEKHSARARRELEAIAALPDGPAVYRRMRNSGEIPASVAVVLKTLNPVLFERLEREGLEERN